MEGQAEEEEEEEEAAEEEEEEEAEKPFPSLTMVMPCLHETTQSLVVTPAPSRASPHPRTSSPEDHPTSPPPPASQHSDYSGDTMSSVVQEYV